MGRVAIVTDSTSDLPEDLRRERDITMVPLNVHFGDEVYRDQIDLSSDQFLARLKTTSTLPTTSQPAPAVFAETFRHLAKDHDSIVAVLISEKLSGTLQSATLAKQEIGDAIPIEIVDSRSASLGLGLQVLRAADLADRNLDAATIANRLRAETAANHLVFFVDSLEFLQRNGRIGRAAALIGGVLQLKPLLRVDEGQVVPFERTRTRAKAILGLIEFVRGFPHAERIGVLSTSGEQEGNAVADRLAEETQRPRAEINVVEMGPVISTHVGPGAIGVALYEGEII